MQKFFLILILILFVAPVFAEEINDKETEAEGPGVRCDDCGEHTSDSERDNNTNPEVLAPLHTALSVGEPAQETQESKSSKGVKD